ncbi:MAG: 5'-3' exonuclease H3TH domain-containing protein, partial [Acutalibacteraceae bacterium]
MRLLVLDGNSIVNRAFYGIKLLTTKDGQFTNGIYGFLNILIKLKEECQPDHVAIAFDLKAPTFRHKMFDGYKAGRKGMPPELASQMPLLKEILSSLGYAIVEKEGYEADDILGTLSAGCKGDDRCFLATGDRDSLQLVSDNTSVLLAATKMGKAVTTVYDKEKLFEEYGVEPKQMIEIKALMGDSSDNIPGVAGIGKKTAGDLIVKYGNIDYIYKNLEQLDIKKGVHD